MSPPRDNDPPRSRDENHRHHRRTSFLGNLFSSFPQPPNQSLHDGDMSFLRGRRVEANQSRSDLGLSESPTSSHQDSGFYSPSKSTDGGHFGWGARSLTSPQSSTASSIFPAMAGHDKGPDQSALHQSQASLPDSTSRLAPRPVPVANHTRRSSISQGISGLIWPTHTSPSNPQYFEDPRSATSTVPRSLPDSAQPNAPHRRGSSIPFPFRRAFELPNYSNVYEEESLGHPNGDNSQSEPRPTSRARSGSLLESLRFTPHVGTNGPQRSSALNEPGAPGAVTGNGSAREGQSDTPGRAQHRRRLSPMGERMIREHPF